MNKKNKKDPLQTFGEEIRDNNTARLLLSFLIAVLCWMLVINVIQPGTDVTFYDVPVSFSYGSEEYIDNNLHILGEPEAFVNITVEGDGTIIGALSKEDFLVYPDYSNVEEAGETSLKLIVESSSPDASRFTASITGLVQRVTVDFDVIISKKLSVEMTSDSLVIDEGYVLVGTEVSPTEVIVTGPSSEVSLITKVTAQANFPQSLNENYLKTLELQFLDKDGNPVEFVDASADYTEVDIELSVYKKAELPVVVQFINAPSNFDDSVLKYSLSHETLKVIGEEEIINGLTEISIGVIDLSTFAIDKTYEMDIVLPQGIQLQENIGKVTVSFDGSDMATTTLNISNENVQVRNLPSNYTIEFDDERIMNVVLAGPSEAIAELSADSVIAVIDMDNFTIALGEQTIPVSLYVPANNQIFAVGNYTIQSIIESP